MKSPPKRKKHRPVASTATAKPTRRKRKRVASSTAASAATTHAKAAPAALAENSSPEIPAAPVPSRLPVAPASEAPKKTADEELTAITGDINDAYFDARRRALLFLEDLQRLKKCLRQAKRQVGKERWKEWVTRVPAILLDEANVCRSLPDLPLYEGSPVSATTRISLGDMVRLLQPSVRAFMLDAEEPSAGPGATATPPASASSNNRHQLVTSQASDASYEDLVAQLQAPGLGESQRAARAVLVLEQLAVARSTGSTSEATSPGRRDLSAALDGVKSQSLGLAQKLRQSSRTLFARVLNGELTVQAAMEQFWHQNTSPQHGTNKKIVHRAAASHFKSSRTRSRK